MAERQVLEDTAAKFQDEDSEWEYEYDDTETEVSRSIPCRRLFAKQV